jgi:hypothetical protein
MVQLCRTDHVVSVYAAMGQDSAVLLVLCDGGEWGRAGVLREIEQPLKG